MMVVIVPSGEFFFTKTKKKKKNVDLASHPRTNIKQYIQVSGCYRRGGRGWVALFLVARLSSPVPCVKPGGEFSPSRRTALFLSTSRVGHGMEAGQQWENVKSLPLWDPSCPETWGKGGVEQGEDGGGAKESGPQNDSSCPTERSPLGVEARDEPLSMLSEPELWCCCSEPALDVMVDEDVEEERVFSLKSVMITVTFPTVIANCWAVLRSMFFSLGLRGIEERKKEKKTLITRNGNHNMCVSATTRWRLPALWGRLH